MPEPAMPETTQTAAAVPSSVGPIVVAGGPTKQEVAAIVAAIEMLWPQPASAATPRGNQPTVWRYSGRWWQQGRLPNRWG